jgi:hypothetical protein
MSTYILFSPCIFVLLYMSPAIAWGIGGGGDRGSTATCGAHFLGQWVDVLIWKKMEIRVGRGGMGVASGI